MHLKHVFASISIAVTIAATAQALWGEEFYSYVDENGVQVFTNIPSISGNTPASTDYVQGNRSVAPASNPNASSYTKNLKSKSSSFDSIIKKYANYYELDPSLIHSIIATESGFNPNAVSSKGACGLMQLMPATAKRWGIQDSFDPEQNIQAGVRHFRLLMDMFNNDLNLSLAAYNAGENLVKRLGRVPKYKETIHYVQSVKRRYEERRQTVGAMEDISKPPTFRYVDAAGVLHLSNIPPTR